MTAGVAVAIFLAMAGCGGLLQVPRHGFAEVFFATLALTGTLAIPLMMAFA